MWDLIILGMGNSRIDCPYDTEVWGLNNGYRQVGWHNRDKTIAPEELERLRSLSPDGKTEAFDIQTQIDMYEHFLTVPFAKMDKLFIFHRSQEWDADGDPIFDFDEINGLLDKGLKMVTLYDMEELPRAHRLHLEDFIAYFETEYFSDSIAYMIAYSIMLNTTKEDGCLKLKEPMRIRLYGVDMHTKDEYNTERGGIEYFVGMARGIGINVWIHPESSVCKTVTGKPYGDWYHDLTGVDPHNIMELQNTEDGLDILHEMGLVDYGRRDRMKVLLREKNEELSGTES